MLATADLVAGDSERESFSNAATGVEGFCATSNCSSGSTDCAIWARRAVLVAALLALARANRTTSSSVTHQSGEVLQIHFGSCTPTQAAGHEPCAFAPDRKEHSALRWSTKGNESVLGPRWASEASQKRRFSDTPETRRRARAYARARRLQNSCPKSVLRRHPLRTDDQQDAGWTSWGSAQ